MTTVAISTDNKHQLIDAGGTPVGEGESRLVVREDLSQISEPLPLGSFLAHNPGYWEVVLGEEGKKA